ncbi:cobaltochelatase subunit CobN [Pseudanabaena sp. PCC 6802]|uniref:cobaltochelatase subunit CobN n=1 Tax=Pseudanabaena sp. PCC 6802 TaxID=118173 RepID=UPI00034D4DD0|nr:cobaltochelatase subunit CobN [Pseudanabaena sp. PCC 6802]
MHRLAALPGGWSPEQEGVVFVEQTPAPIVILTAADTDIQTLAIAVQSLPSECPTLRVANLLNLQQELSIDTYAEQVLARADAIVLRLLGGRSYWSYGLEVCKSLASDTNKKLIVLPGDDRFDPELASHSNVAFSDVDYLWRYFLNGGVDNAIAAIQFLCDRYLGTNYQPPPPITIPQIGPYKWQAKLSDSWIPNFQHPKAGILFYRAHYLAGNLAPVDALCQSLSDRGIAPVPVFIYSLQDPDLEAALSEYFHGIDVLLNTTSFSLTKPGNEDKGGIWQRLNVPILQVICSSSTLEQWQARSLGLSPRDVAMNVVLPEVDGRIITRAVSFKSVEQRSERLETDITVYEPASDRINFVADLAANWVKLRRKPIGDRKIALILANYPTRNGRLANGVGLDTPASCVEILKAMQATGYAVRDIPKDSDELIGRLTQGVTNDPESQLGFGVWGASRDCRGSAPVPAPNLSFRPTDEMGNWILSEEYRRLFDTLSDVVKEQVLERWGEPEFDLNGSGFAIPGLQLGNVFVGIQPARGYDRDPSLNYHAPDLEPTHAYFAFYLWLRHVFQADAIAHIGKHGNLEWLPGKGIALSENCFPEATLGAMPHLYPFIVNDPGEGSQAKRRAQAVIIDHLTPPMTRAETYGNLQKLEHLIDEYHSAQSLDPSRTPLIQQKILDLIAQENLTYDLQIQNPQPPTLGKGLAFVRSSSHQTQEFLTNANPLHRPPIPQPQFSQLLTQTDGYLCDLKEAQIRDGLHIFGQCPTGRQLRDLIVAIARYPGNGKLGITQAIAQSCQLDFDPLTADPSQAFTDLPPQLQSYLDGQCRIVGDAIEAIENYAAAIVDKFLNKPLHGQHDDLDRTSPQVPPGMLDLLNSIYQPLCRTGDETANFLKGLQGEYIPSGASGAPTRGRLDVLPTGRNFYSVDIRSIPTETAWDVGRRSAEILVETYTQEHGEYPRTLGLSVWGTSTMRTGGDDLAEALALIGVRPVWDGISRRVVDFEIMPLSILNRPRVDVMLRISGFFRDGFANSIDLFQSAVEAVSQLDEPDDLNPIKANIQRDIQMFAQAFVREGIAESEAIAQADTQAKYRVFGSKPGAYGAGLQGLIESQNWQSDRDLAEAYLNWSSYAYTGYGEAATAPHALRQRLSQMQIVLHNQDNREHDLLDSDDYYQFQGGMTASVRSLTGQNPHTYFGDNALPHNPKVRSLSAEISRVYRSRVVNPKWIEGAMRHGYKGAFEIAATVDYLFAYDATANCVADFMYEGVANAYLFDPDVQDFVKTKNPWALRDMAERMLEAHQRDLWQNAPAQMLSSLRDLVLSAEAAIEEQTINLGGESR